MDAAEILEFCHSLSPEVYECFPFGEDALVLKTREEKGKMFALLSLDSSYLCVKCEPEQAKQLREEYDYVEPAYHFNKVHWNGIYIERAKAAQIKEWVENSFLLVNGSNKKKKR